jgi:cellobiose phosphorylase
VLQPGKRAQLVFVLGYVENPVDEKWERPGVVNKAPARALLARFAEPSQVEAAVAELRNYWSDLLGAYVLDSPDERLNRMVNT